MLLLFVIFTVIVHLDLCFTDSIEDYGYTMPDYGFEWTEKPYLRNKLSKKFALQKQSDAKIKKLKERIGNDTEYYDDVPHFKITTSKKVKENSDRFEDGFKKIMQMVGVTYTYKRDLYWRTWREVKYRDRNTEVVCYKCQNTVNCTDAKCTDCHAGGYWAIEEELPPCSFEILSITDNKQICIGHFWELDKAKSGSCPALINFEELSQCNNPILTKVHITADYSTTASERASTVICQGRETCEFTTLYKTDSSNIIFRIINSTNDVIYSRIMSNNGEVYACTDDCGHFDPETTTVTRSENHLILNLLNDYPRKRKREDEASLAIQKKSEKDGLKNNLRQNLYHKMHKYVIEQPFKTEKHIPFKTTLSFCNQIVLRELDKDYDYDSMK